jgi:phosphopantetheinyl transferase (holo-ACP synthase)
VIGNDIVDLKLAAVESNWRRKGFLDKIFTNSEQNYILDAVNSELMVWNLWSRKEAAYKIWNRNSKIRAFNPIQFECFNVFEKRGFVNFGEQQYNTKTVTTDQFVYTIAFGKKILFSNIKNIQGKKIIKENGLPYKDFAGNNEKTISITHHGRFEKIIMI